MNVLIIEVGKAPYVKEIEDSNKAIQDIVGGYYKEIIIDNHFRLLCNEDGLRLQLPYNKTVGRHKIVGTFLLTGVDEEFEEYSSLTDSEIEVYTKHFKAMS